jgi:hypothetical protein
VSRTVSSCCGAQVLLEVQQLLLRLDKSSEGRVKRMLLFMSARGHRSKQLFDKLGQELRACLLKLLALLGISPPTLQVRPLTAAPRYQPAVFAPPPALGACCSMQNHRSTRSR